MENGGSFRKWFSANWERVLFVIVGLAFLCICFYMLYLQKVTEAAAVFGLGFLSFLYANVSRFKRFKGLGFEAELWEDKQKEAADLIERLRDVVSIYTREVILGKVTSGRWGSKVDWASHWQLYNDLVTQHNVLGQKIDFTGVKKVMDDYFLFDMCMPEIKQIREATNKGKNAARKKIDEEFGSPIHDIEGFNSRWAQFREIPDDIRDPFLISTTDDLAGHALKVWEETKERLKLNFGVEADIDTKVIERLETISKLYQSRPVIVTEELIGWSNRDD
ncbi:hypothetical protein [Agrobacterium deltaense]|uniref:hypothetical protein n=1 Tax=Agrobacterium deltaense TaxID=1183412 RepID=UPI0009BBCAF9|nr:hypothetical protein [Agrobacterium deltaense]CUX49089.1 conserved hypothetical protein [Agrobacterium deltaense RV3]